MPVSESNNKRIAKNTLFLYFRMILLMAVSLYTSRVVLATLGVEDYGVYNAVGGFIGMLAFLNGAMSGSTQRFIAVELGRGNKESLQRVFSTCVIIHAVIALFVLLIAETIGMWFLLKKMIIPDDRMNAAIVVFQCSVITSIVHIMSYPYNADIIVHEKMSAFAYISIFEACANLLIVFLIQIGSYDRLVLYAIALLLVKISVIMTYRIYCKRHFFETSVKKILDKNLIRQIIVFTGWNLWGGMAGTLMGQGLNMLLNVFFGPVVNAARGLAVQVQTAVHLFATNFQMALNPQIMKTYAIGDTCAMHSLIYRSSKFTFMLLLCIILPIIVEVDTILKLWLGNVPNYTGIFVILTLCICLIDSVSNPFMTASAATGRVKKYQFVVGSILISIVPISYVVLRMGGEPYSVFIVHIIVGLVASIARLLIVRSLVALSIRKYFEFVVLPCIFVAIPSVSFAGFVRFIIPRENLLFSLVCVVLIVLVSAIFSFFFGLSKNERVFFLNEMRKKL